MLLEFDLRILSLKAVSLRGFSQKNRERLFEILYTNSYRISLKLTSLQFMNSR